MPNYGKRMLKESLIKKLEQGTLYDAGDGINIANGTIAIDNTVALKSELFSGNYNDLTNKPTIPDAVSGTNDGTNWTSLTVGNDTYAIPQGGGATYTAGIGIDIVNNEISIDNTVALKSELFSGDYNDLTNKPTFSAAVIRTWEDD